MISEPGKSKCGVSSEATLASAGDSDTGGSIGSVDMMLVVLLL